MILMEELKGLLMTKNIRCTTTKEMGQKYV